LKFIVAPLTLTFISIVIAIDIDSDVSGVSAARVAPTILLIREALSSARFKRRYHQWKRNESSCINDSNPTNNDSQLLFSGKSVVIYVSIVIYVVAKNALVVYGMRRRLGNERAILFGM